MAISTFYSGLSYCLELKNQTLGAKIQTLLSEEPLALLWQIKLHNLPFDVSDLSVLLGLS